MKNSMPTGLFVLFSLVVFLTGCTNPQQEKPVPPKSNDPVQARIDAITKELEKKPKAADLYFERAQLRQQIEFMEGALNDYYMATRIDSTKPQYYLAIADFFVQTGNVEKSIEASEIGAKLDAKNPKHHINAAKSALVLKDYPRAIDFVNKALMIDKFNPQAYFFKGYAYDEMGNKEKAISSFITASEQDPTWDIPFQHIGMIYAEQKNDLALKYFDNAFAANPKNTEAIYQKALYYKETKRIDEALKELKNIIAVRPQYSKAIFAVGNILFDQGKIEEALKNFILCTAVEKTYYKAYYMAGQCYEKKQQKEQAREAYKTCLIFKEDCQEAKDALKKL